MSLALKQEQGQEQTKTSPFAENKKITYKDYLNWPDDVRAEVIQGVAYMMAPPSTTHQRSAGRLFNTLSAFLKGRTCEAFIAPFGVRLFPEEDKTDDTVVEPDIVVICDPSKIDEQGCKGAPDLVIEILSPSTKRKDKTIKLQLYQKAGVREYWIVSPEDKDIEVHHFENNSIELFGVNKEETHDTNKLPEIAPVNVLPGLEIDVKEIF